MDRNDQYKDFFFCIPSACRTPATRIYCAAPRSSFISFTSLMFFPTCRDLIQCSSVWQAGTSAGFPSGPFPHRFLPVNNIPLHFGYSHRPFVPPFPPKKSLFYIVGFAYISITRLQIARMECLYGKTQIGMFSPNKITATYGELLEQSGFAIPVILRMRVAVHKDAKVYHPAGFIAEEHPQ